MVKEQSQQPHTTYPNGWGEKRGCGLVVRFQGRQPAGVMNKLADYTILLELTRHSRLLHYYLDRVG